MDLYDIPADEQPIADTYEKRIAGVPDSIDTTVLYGSLSDTETADGRAAALYAARGMLAAADTWWGALDEAHSELSLLHRTGTAWFVGEHRQYLHAVHELHREITRWSVGASAAIDDADGVTAFSNGLAAA